MENSLSRDASVLKFSGRSFGFSRDTLQIVEKHHAEEFFTKFVDLNPDWMTSKFNGIFIVQKYIFNKISWRPISSFYAKLLIVRETDTGLNITCA